MRLPLMDYIVEIRQIKIQRRGLPDQLWTAKLLLCKSILTVDFFKPLYGR